MRADLTGHGNPTLFGRNWLDWPYPVKMFEFLNQCFARLQVWKSVSDSQNLLDGATAVMLETLFQNRSRTKH